MAYVDEQTQRINDLYNTLKKQQTDQATTQNNQAITTLRQQLAEQLPQYQTARAQADVGQVQDFNKLKEYMASNGSFSSGDNLSRAGNILTLRANKVNQINGNENQFTTGINTKIADSNNQYQNTVNNISSTLDAQKAKDLASLMEQIRQQELAQQEAEKQRQFQAQQADLAYQRQAALQQAAAKAAAAKAASSRSSSSSSKAATAQKTADTNAVWNELYANINQRTGEQFLQENRSGIISNLGATEYNKMLSYAKNYQYSAAENQRYGRNMKDATPQNYYRDMG
jgi:hypothetical protein